MRIVMTVVAIQYTYILTVGVNGVLNNKEGRRGALGTSSHSLFGQSYIRVRSNTPVVSLNKKR